MSAKEKQNINIDFIRREIFKVGPKIFDMKNKQKSEYELSASKRQSKTRIVKVSTEYLKSLDPKDWKNQDHYQVLGLQKLRYLSTPDDIRQAFKMILVDHHPDERRSKGETVNLANDYFTCIIKAYEILSVPKSKMAYDSVDPEFDNSLPNKKQIQNKFYSTFRRCFRLNSRWSKKADVPSFGNKSSSRDDVERFYKFWYNFKSWREFSYLDKQYKAVGQNDREKRRAIEKENRINRYKRKKEEMLRIRNLVDLAYNNDERIQKFKDEEREKRMLARKAKLEAIQSLKVKKLHKTKEKPTVKFQNEVNEPKRTTKITLPLEKQKVALQRQQRIFRDKIKEYNYFEKNRTRDVLKIKRGIELICDNFNLEKLRTLNRSLAGKNANLTFNKALEDVKEKLGMEGKRKDARAVMKCSTSFGKRNVNNMTDIWNTKNNELFVKALSLHPTNTHQRCKAIANFINQSSGSVTCVKPADVLYKLKLLRKNHLKYTVRNMATIKQYNCIPDKGPSTKVTIGKCITTAGKSTGGAKTKNKTDHMKTEQADAMQSKQQQTQPMAIMKIWTKQERLLLEKAIQAFPLSSSKRWYHIYKQLPHRSKLECLRKIKEIVKNSNLKKMTNNGK